MAMFPDAWLGELLSKTDIVSLISEYTSLTPKGQRLWGLCPFHGEKTPSFSVTPDKQMYYCFGCHAGGGAVQFVMAAEKLTFVEAVKYLAQRAGMELPGTVDDEQLRRERQERERIYEANREAARFFVKSLLSDEGARGRGYLKKRGLGTEMVKRFGLGYAKPGWDSLLTHLTGLGFREQELAKAGLAIKSNKREGFYDTFRDRVMFPIIGTNGKVLGFGARTMGDDLPKYLNTGDTPVFNKRYQLYALNLMKGKNIADLVLCEGYMDVISLHKAGVDNAVASLGTSLTSSQAHLIKRYVNTVYLCYDGDSAGQNATMRALDILSREGLTPKVIRLPGTMDPDDFVKANGKEGFERLKEKAMSQSSFKLAFMAEGFDLNTDDGREAYAKKACEYIASLPPVERERHYIALSRRTGIAAEILSAQGAARGAPEIRASLARAKSTREKKEPTQDDERLRAEKTLIACLAADYDTAMETLVKLSPGFFRTPAFERFTESLLIAYTETKTPDLALLLSSLSGEDAELVSGAIQLIDGLKEPKKTANDCLAAIERTELVDKIRNLTRETERLELSEDRRRELTEEILACQRKLRPSK